MFKDRPSVKDFVQSLGIPKTEVNLILVNGNKVTEDYILQNGDYISIFPEFGFLTSENKIKEVAFLCDVQLGKLSRLLRLLGFDVLYSNSAEATEVISIAQNSRRVILTRNLNLLKMNSVREGYFVRNTNPERQAAEVIKKFKLANYVKKFSRCLVCGGLLKEVSKEEILKKIPQRVEQYFNEFFYCPRCRKVYWKGSHYKRMNEIIERIINEVN